MRVLQTFVVAALMATTAWTPTHAAERVDLLLVLAADVSGSMDKSKFELQRSGYAAAFSNPRVIEALRGGPRARVAAAFIEWSGVLQQKVVIDWTIISNDETARQFGHRIMEAPRAFLATLMDSGVEFIAVDNPHANKLTVHILAAVAQHEREIISARTSAALKAAKARGK